MAILACFVASELQSADAIIVGHLAFHSLRGHNNSTIATLDGSCNREAIRSGTGRLARAQKQTQTQTHIPFSCYFLLLAAARMATQDGSGL